MVKIDPCLPSGLGKDYQVGPNSGQIASLDLVPWENLAAGDTVRIFYQSNPYRGHILIAANGTADKPVRVCGVKGPNGERPIIDGENAIARKGLKYTSANNADEPNIQENRSIILIDRLDTQDWGTAYPAYIQLDGFEIRHAYSNYNFVNSLGNNASYNDDKNQTMYFKYDTTTNYYDDSGLKYLSIYKDLNITRTAQNITISAQNDSIKSQNIILKAQGKPLLPLIPLIPLAGLITLINYDSFGGCIWIERGKNIVIADNVIHDCTNGIFARSVDIGAGMSTIIENLKITGNYVYGNGVVGDDHEHNMYIQTIHPIYEFNHVGPQRDGANGSGIKDRSVGTIIRYNFIEECANSLELVESEDFPQTAMSYPEYHTTIVYGNIITKDSSTGSAVRYGGDHFYSTPGEIWGEPIFKKGTLYFFHNTVNITGTNQQIIFQLATTEEKAEIWNNVLNFASTVTNPGLRAWSSWNPINTSYWTPDGTLNFSKNWSVKNITDAAGNSVQGTLTGMSNIIKGTTSPVDTNYKPLAGSAIIDASKAPIATTAEAAAALAAVVANYPVLYQYDISTMQGKVRTQVGSAMDIGAIEYAP